MKRILLFIAIALYGLSVLQAQITCTEQLTNAQRSFDDGLLDDIPGLVADCMEDGFTSEEKANAYKLLIQTYLFTEEIEKADEIMIQFLTEFPSYSIAVNDPREFVDLYNTYRTEPIYNLEFLLNGTLTIPVVLISPSVTDRNSDLNEYSPGVGFNFEANYIDNLVGDYSYSAGLSFHYSRLGFYNEPNTYNYLEATFNSMSVGVPLAIRYDFDFKGINFYAKAGIEPTFLLSYKASLDLYIRGIGDAVESKVKTLTPYHRRYDIQPFLGIGAKINIGRDQLHIAAGYKLGTIPHSPKDFRYVDNELSNRFKYVESDMLWTTPTLSVSYFRPIYKPKKIR